MDGVLSRFLQCPVGPVWPFGLAPAAGYSMIFDTGGERRMALLEVGRERLGVELEADVAMKLPVVGVTGITLSRAPDLP